MIGAQKICHVVTDNPNVNKALRRQISEDYPHIIGSPCTTHQFDLFLEHVGKLAWVKGVLSNCKDIVTNVKNYDMILNKFRKYSKLELLKPGETRFATQFIMLDSLKDCKQAALNCYFDPSLAESVSAKSQSYKDLFKVAKDLIFDPKFWKDVDYIHSIMEPIILLLRLTDNNNKIPVGFVGILYHKYFYHSCG